MFQIELEKHASWREDYKRVIDFRGAYIGTQMSYKIYINWEGFEEKSLTPQNAWSKLFIKKEKMPYIQKKSRPLRAYKISTLGIDLSLDLLTEFNVAPCRSMSVKSHSPERPSDLSQLPHSFLILMSTFEPPYWVLWMLLSPEQIHVAFILLIFFIWFSYQRFTRSSLFD